MSLTQREAGLADILANPADDAPRLIFADWLEEHGEPERAEFIRVQVGLVVMRLCGQPAVWSDADPENVQYDALRRRERELWAKAADEAMQLDEPLWGLFPEWSITGWSPNELHLVHRRWDSHPEFRATFRRGFVAAVICEASAWLAHGKAIRRVHPIEHVTLAGKRPEPHTPPHGETNYSWYSIGFNDDAATIPSELLDLLKGGLYGLSVERVAYPTEADALEALSAACIAWAKEGGIA